jgi:hypothetical protein
MNASRPDVSIAIMSLGLIGVNGFLWYSAYHIATKDNIVKKFMKDLYVCSPTRYDLFIKDFKYDRFSPYSRSDQLEAYMRMCAEQPFRMSVISGCDRH